MKVVNKMNEYGETISEVMTTNKVLRTLNLIYDHIVMAIKESNALRHIKLEDVKGYLMKLMNL